MRTKVLVVLLGTGLGLHHLSADVIQRVDLNTTPLAGTAGYLVLDFFGGAPIQFNTVTISGFSSDWALQSGSPTGGATGTLVPGPLTLNDSEFFNEWSQQIVFGSKASFVMQLTTNASVGGVPDDFAIYVLNSSGVPYGTTDPTGAGALVNISVDHDNPVIAVYSSSSASVNVSPAATVPEPSSAILTLSSVLLCGLVRRIARRGGRRFE